MNPSDFTKIIPGLRYSLLHYFCYNDMIKCFKYVLSCDNININVQELGRYSTVLHTAVRCKNKSMVELLLNDARTDIYKGDIIFNNPLELIYKYDGITTDEIAELLKYHYRNN